MRRQKYLVGILSVLALAICIILSCAQLPSDSNISPMVKAWAEHGEPASVALYKVEFEFKGSYETLNDFLKRVKADFEFLKKQGHEIIKIEYNYGKDLTQKTVVMNAIIYYKESKKQTKMEG